jgi:hypothetical protein
MNELIRFMRDDLGAGDVPTGARALVDKLQAHHGAAMLGVLMYGSCRRKLDATEGLVDLLVIVSSYRAAFGTGTLALANWMLPPNVFYLQAEHAGQTVRCKYAVISLEQFRRRAQSRIDHYFWARFCQPARLLCGDQATRQALAECRALAALAFARRIAPLITQASTALDVWVQALGQTYRCELRPEPPGSARQLINHDPDYWTRLTALLARQAIGLHLEPGGHYLGSSGKIRQRAQQAAWLCRRPVGKLFNLARLFKAAGTFSNGIDYIVWKVERHSGVRIEPTERMRRHPRLAAWGLVWRLWRKGGFR